MRPIKQVMGDGQIPFTTGRRTTVNQNLLLCHTLKKDEAVWISLLTKCLLCGRIITEVLTLHFWNPTSYAVHTSYDSRNVSGVILSGRIVVSGTSFQQTVLKWFKTNSHISSNLHNINLLKFKNSLMTMITNAFRTFTYTYIAMSTHIEQNGVVKGRKTSGFRGKK